jgi:hypothetical protein
LTWRSHKPTEIEIKINIETWLILGIDSCKRLTRVKIWYWNVNICCNLGIDMLKFFSTFVSAIQRCMLKVETYVGHGLDNFLPCWGLHVNLLPGWRKEEGANIGEIWIELFSGQFAMNIIYSKKNLFLSIFSSWFMKCGVVVSTNGCFTRR